MIARPVADTGLDALDPLAPPKPAAAPIAPAPTAKPAPAVPPASPLSALPGTNSPGPSTTNPADVAPLPVTAPVSAPPMVNQAPIPASPGPSVSNPGDLYGPDGPNADLPNGGLLNAPPTPFTPSAPGSGGMVQPLQAQLAAAAPTPIAPTPAAPQSWDITQMLGGPNDANAQHMIAQMKATGRDPVTGEASALNQAVLNKGYTWGPNGDIIDDGRVVGNANDLGTAGVAALSPKPNRDANGDLPGGLNPQVLPQFDMSQAPIQQAAQAAAAKAAAPPAPASPVAPSGPATPPSVAPVVPPTPPVTPSPLPSTPAPAAESVASTVTPPQVNNAPIPVNPAAPTPSVTNPSDVPPVGGAASGAPMPVGPTSPAGNVSTTPYTADQNLIDQTISRAPTADRFKIAGDQWNSWQQATDPAYQAATRDAMRKAAAGGALGSGMLQTSEGDLAQNRQLAMDTQKSNFLNDALKGTISDSQYDTGVAQQQQGFQSGQQQTAFNQNQSATQLQDTLQNSSFGRALQALLAGSSGNPADTSLILSQIFGNQATGASSALGGLISGTTTNNATAGSGNQLQDIIKQILAGYGGGTSAPAPASSGNPTN